ncbi:WXG100 family type VII secretion target [Amycolatopsis suaedae]|uniref:PPE domain-containing protein n=1 Tax=Amycolatopsis suaedae TaxID=2510978 RepID=A0A4Q7J3T6_9PSEU|nr:hypothetical protein [Amycolatopsis suaedae]RZQ61637.1 hypothetical protein EWH70_21975 [Amycolatopsis suaedae]
MAPREDDGYGQGGQGTSSVPLGDNSESASIVESARGRSDGFDVGSDRAITTLPNWDAQESEQLYHGATVNNDPTTAAATSQAWGNHSRDLNQAANDLYNAISELGAAWVGKGAGAAQGTLVAIANSSSQASEAAQAMSTRLQQQAAAAEEVKKMPAPKTFDPAAQTAAMLAGGPAAMVADMKAQHDAANAVKAQQVAMFNAYTQAMSEVDSSTPSFGPASLGLKSYSGSGQGSYGIGNVGAGAGGPGAVGVSGVGGSISSVNAATAGISDNTTQAGYTGAGPAAGAASGAGAPAPQAPAPSMGSNSAAALGAAGLGGAVGLAGGKALGQGNRSGATRQSSTDAAAPAAAQPAAGAVPQQAPGMVSPGGTIGGGAPMTPGMGGMGMGGAAGAQQQEEEEHTHASFLIEPDPDDAFGANEATPPPVIGAWSEDEDR